MVHAHERCTRTDVMLGKVKQWMQTYHPSDEEEKMIIQNWKSSWDSKILGPISVKTQLKAVLFSQQHSSNLEIFLQNLLKTDIEKNNCSTKRTVI